MKRISVLFVCVLFFSDVAWTMGVLPLPATEETQILNFTTLTQTVAEAKRQVQKLASIVNQNLQIIENYKRQALTVPNLVWNDTAQTIRELVNTKKRAEGLISSVQNIDEEFKRKFKGYEHWLKYQKGSVNFSKEYRNWNQQYQTSAKNCLTRIFHR